MYTSLLECYCHSNKEKLKTSKGLCSLKRPPSLSRKTLYSGVEASITKLVPKCESNIRVTYTRGRGYLTMEALPHRPGKRKRAETIQWAWRKRKLCKQGCRDSFTCRFVYHDLALCTVIGLFCHWLHHWHWGRTWTTYKPKRCWGSFFHSTLKARVAEDKWSINVGMVSICCQYEWYKLCK